MVVFGKKTIHYWNFWRTKNKLYFCLASGALYSVLMFIGNLMIRAILGLSENLLATSFYIALGSFIAGSFLSLAVWYENERRFKLWQETDKQQL